LKKQDLNNVDALTGATWSHNLFVSSTAIALKKAKAKTENN
jgi:major membrane immunogen (membrane-anchored lipoprotein)